MSPHCVDWGEVQYKSERLNTQPFQELGLPVSISGSAAAADSAYGEVGVFEVSFFGVGSVCGGPNYIVQE